MSETMNRRDVTGTCGMALAAELPILSPSGVERACRALGVTARTPLSRLVVLEPGQYVVEVRIPRVGELHITEYGTVEHAVYAGKLRTRRKPIVVRSVGTDGAVTSAEGTAT